MKKSETFLTQAHAELIKKFPESQYHIFYCPEPFNQTTDGLKNMMVDQKKIIYKTYPANGNGKHTLRWTDKPNLFLGFKYVAFMISE